MNIKEIYQKFKRKYNLPDFDDIDNEFEISTIEEEHFLLREIRRKMHDKLSTLSKFLKQILFPEADIIDMHESRTFTDEEREKIYSLFRTILYLLRQNMLTALDESDQKTADYIKLVWQKWKTIKKESKWIIEKSAKSWTKETELKEELAYLG
ncbi:hypothetical protein DRJ19_04970 [Candidatus Woesearchaeota archaeon]|nr:MAG: hypothetical protein DRJ19_04970 [Candidatus Woesearchaeota archaeon]HDM43607.1 hypothetical protein [Candidatus Woesearchaeota archaeon]